jgi:flagellar hook-basal body complex protein FliE
MMQSVLSPIAAVMPALSNLVGAGGSGALSPLAGQGAAPTPFADLMTDAIGQVNQLQDQAHTAVAGLMSGSGVDVHQAMIATEKASMAFDLALAVRNKAVQAYQTVIGMQF